MKKRIAVVLSIICVIAAAAEAKRAPVPQDLFALKDVNDARVSPDGMTVVYAVTSMDQEKNRYASNLWLVPIDGGQPSQLTTGDWSDATPRWSPDGKMIAFQSNREGSQAIWVVDVQTRKLNRIVEWARSNAFLSKAGEMFCWSPDSRQIAFVAAEPSKKPVSSDPLIVSRIQYKTRTSFADNLRSHIFIATIADGQVRQLTRGQFDEHSIAWSPGGEEIAFLSNREMDPDANFNYDIFTIEVKTNREQRLTQTPGVEFSPVWSPDGKAIAYAATKRKLTTIDSVAEDTHIWVIDRETLKATEVTATFDRRCTSPQWAGDERIVFLASDHGRTLLYSVERQGGVVSPLFEKACQVNSFSISLSARYVFTMSDDAAPAEVYTVQKQGELSRLTSVNTETVAGWNLSKPERISFKSFDGTDIEGWLVRPPDLAAGKKCPMLLTIHGGPHGMYGYSFNLANQIYAARGYGMLYINPRGSSGYGQKFSDGSVGNWGGGDYQDLMKAVDYTLAKYTWIDANRLGVMGGSYGGFMTNWVITQTPRFKAAIALASLSNLISFYATSLYQDLIHTEFNGLPWDNYELLWKYSPIRYVKNVSTPTMFIHGEQDNDVHITQAEEMYMGLKRRGIESVLVRYPREGHGLREPLHRLDQIVRTLAWFDRFIKPNVE